MATIGSLVARARRMVRGHRREIFNQLATVIDTDDTTLTFTRALPPIVAGTYLGLGPEIVYVTSIDANAKTAVVVRGVDGTPGTAQLVDAVVEVNWRWFTGDLLSMLSDELRSWPDTIYSVATQDVTVGVSQRSVTLPLTRYRFPLRVRRRATTPTADATAEWTSVPIKQYRIETNLPTSDYTDGNAFIAASTSAAARYRVEYAQALNLAAVEALATDIATIPLSDFLIDAAVYGVAWRALAGDDADRTNNASQPEPREAEEIKPFDALRQASAYKALRDLRLNEEARRLRQLYGLKVA